MKNWIRLMPTKSGQHGVKDHDGNRESHQGLEDLKGDKEVQQELARRNKRKKGL